VEGWRQGVYIVIGLFIGVVFHEYMHGRVADYYGDHTARNQGRLTLNPIPHLDPFGTVLLPLALLLISGGSFAFGYAKPVPVNPFFLRKRRDMVLVALAGPVTNFVIAVAIALIGRILNLAGVSTTAATSTGIPEIYMLLIYASFINVFLGIFNLIPVPPLDGSHILEYYLPASAAATYGRIAPFGFIAAFAVVYLFGNLIVHPIMVLLTKIMGLPYVV
jgi:Zn-dependent protease